ncbi:MAG: 2-amino-4-hydroxy-6-hydroxymethyldihydropteridine diphosphokinase [Candidatus Omnitrophota bacterium]|jgi:2-amino-4-hydroxy-6-hydroxymethyldihydropteridine diphosphokinase
MPICFLGIGSNLGQRRKNIESALERISGLKNTKIIKLSKIRETEPVGGPGGQKKFLNAVLKIDTQLLPSDLLRKLQKIEKELGRRKAVRWGPRTIDLDILLYGDKIITRKELKIPHPRLMERDFVLKPLLDLL